MLTELVPVSSVQRSLLATIDRERRGRLMASLDGLNSRFGRNTLFPAAAAVERAWSTKLEKKSPRFTTNWEELPRVAA